MDSIQGQITKVTYHKVSEYSASGNKFLVAKFIHKEENKKPSLVTIKGEMNSVVYGWDYNLYGSWKDSEEYGPAFAFTSFEPVLPKSHEGMADYLARSVPEIGQIRSRLIVDHFGEDTFKILKLHPERLSEIQGLSRIARREAEKFFSNDNALDIDPVAYSRLYDLLSPIRPPHRVITSLLRNFGCNAPEFITRNPYKLIDYPGMGWTRVDKFATEILKYKKDGIERHKNAIMEVLARRSEDGHTKLDYPTLRSEAFKLLDMSITDESFAALIDNREVIKDEDYVSSWYLYDAETAIALELDRLMASKDNIGFYVDETGLDEEQKPIAAMVESSPVSMISGIPGSGKSYSVSLIVKDIYNKGIEKILIVAPTGKAAKRNHEFMQENAPDVPVDCMTMHRALGAVLSSEEEEGIPEDEAKINRGRDRFTFWHNKENQLDYDFIIIDESSMVDVFLAASFLSAIPSTARLLIVGDHYQLPSVGPGAFLRDLVLAAGIPRVILEKPRRNSGAIAHICYLIKEGRRPDPKAIIGPSNWTHFERNSDNAILDTIRNMHADFIQKHGLEKAKSELQIISPEKKKPLGCFNLNIIIGSLINPFEKMRISKDDDGEPKPRVHDKIVRTKNGLVKMLTLASDSDVDDPELEIRYFQDVPYVTQKVQVVNGDMGEVVEIEDKYIYVMFSSPDRFCMILKKDAYISLAYAMTVHKCQGSGFPFVIMPLTDYYWNERSGTGLFSRELLYTGWSRPIQGLFTVGSIQEAYKAISRVTINQRQTRLKEMIRKEGIHAFS